MPRLRWSPDAIAKAALLRADLVENYGKPYAKRVRKRITQVTAHLRRHPELGRAGLSPGTREAIIGDLPYVIVYEHDEANSVVLVLDVVYSRSDWRPGG